MSVKTRWCEVCKQPLDADRAENVSDTRLCRRHADEIEKYGGEFLVTITQERTSKENSLKKNYGGISATRRRNTEGINRLKDEYERQQWEEASR